MLRLNKSLMYFKHKDTQSYRALSLTEVTNVDIVEIHIER